MDSRLQVLNHWLQQVIGRDDYRIAPASADASFRRYFRVRYDDTTRIVMDAPPEQEDCHAFIAVSSMLLALGLNAPRVLARDLQQGFILLTDLGERSYLDALNQYNADQLYGDAMQALIILQRHSTHALSAYTPELFKEEMYLFRDWYLAHHLKIALDTRQGAIFDETVELLVSEALQQPQVCVHRDYHSRNLMVCDNNPGMLDFQDAVVGPVTYDLVSLLRDCYITWPQQQVAAWLDQYYRLALAAGVLQDVSVAQFTRWFDLMGMQRHLKASGIFARLNYRDHKPGYMDDIPRTLDYVLQVGRQYPELSAFMEMLVALEVVQL